MDSALVKNYPSPATAYEVSLTELGNSNSSQDDKIVKVFNILDELIPNLGVYQKVMKIVRQQLFDSVFSQQFTGSADKDKNNNNINDNKISIERLTYYALYKKLQNERDDRYFELKEKLNDTEKRLNEKLNEINEANKKVDNLQREITTISLTLKQLNDEINEKKVEIYRLEKKLRISSEEYEAKLTDMMTEINNFKESIKIKDEELSNLRIYKNAYDEMHAAFSPSLTEEFTKPRRKQVQSTRKNQILTDITNANKIEEQILTLINISAEEYDQFLEKYNDLMVKEKSVHNTPRHSNFRNFSSQLTDTELNIFEQEIQMEKNTFQRTIAELRNELDLISQHKKSLEEKLFLIEMDRENSEFIKNHRSSVADSSKNKRNLLFGLEEHYEPERKGPDKDQFISHERVLSKWSCVLYTSATGSNWKELKGLKYCENCGDKTLICPHKVTAPETVFKLPANTLYMKVVRPKIQYNQYTVKQAIEMFKKHNEKSGVDIQTGEHSVCLTNYPTSFIAYDENSQALSVLNEGNSDIGFTRTYQFIWDDYSHRTNYDKKVARPFSYERTISVLVQFLAFVHSKESNNAAVVLSILDNLYQYFDKRYELEEIKFSSAYDFLASIYAFSQKSKIIEVFCHVLIGNLDRCVLNFLLYMSEIIDKIEWKETEDVKPFFKIIYPFCDDDELDSLTLDYTSFSENKINKKLVWEFIMTLILNKKEYIINEMLFKLSTQPSQNYYSLTENEFLKAIYEMFYIYDEKQTKIYYETSLKMYNALDGFDDSVPIDKLCYIAAYFCLIQTIQELKYEIDVYITQSREKRKENAISSLDKSNQVVEWKDEYITISYIDALSNSILSNLIDQRDDEIENSLIDQKTGIWEKFT